jgi:hypothetical protein
MNSIHAAYLLLVSSDLSRMYVDYYVNDTQLYYADDENSKLQIKYYTQLPESSVPKSECRKYWGNLHSS